MTSPLRLFLMALLAASLSFVAGCDNDNNNRNDDPVVEEPAPEPEPEPEPEPTGTSFTQFVLDIFASTDVEPVAVDGVELTFDDQENEAAFDALTQ